MYNSSIPKDICPAKKYRNGAVNCLPSSIGDSVNKSAVLRKLRFDTWDYLTTQHSSWTKAYPHHSIVHNVSNMSVHLLFVSHSSDLTISHRFKRRTLQTIGIGTYRQHNTLGYASSTKRILYNSVAKLYSGRSAFSKQIILANVFVYARCRFEANH